MQTVSIIGAGNVAFHLTKAFIQNKVQVQQIYNRTLTKAEKIGKLNNIKYTNEISLLEKADIFILAVADKAIEEASLLIPFKDAMVVHVSGAMPLNTLKGNYRKGVFYPLQTFSVNRLLNYNEIPFLIEAEQANDEQILIDLAKQISDKAAVINSQQRAEIHLSAVWGCNFVNHLYYLAQQTADEAGVPFEYLLPLIKETANKINHLSPKEAQTGPARRVDKVTIEKHLSLIKDTFYKDIYNKLSNSIIKTYNNEL